MRILLDLPNGVCPLSWLMLLAMLRLGGAGCLLWYVLFSLIWIKPQGASEGGGMPSFPRPVHYAVCAQLKAVVYLVTQCILGILYLCAQLVPQGNGWVQGVLCGFLCVLGIEFFVRNLRVLLQIRRGQFCRPERSAHV